MPPPRRAPPSLPLADTQRARDFEPVRRAPNSARTWRPEQPSLATQSSRSRLLSRHRAPPNMPSSHWQGGSENGTLTPRLSEALHTMLTDRGAQPATSPVVEAVRSLVELSQRAPPPLPAGAGAGAHRAPLPPPDLSEQRPLTARVHREAPAPPPRSHRPGVKHRTPPTIEARGWRRPATRTEAVDDLCAEELNASMAVYRAAAGQSRAAW